MSTSLLYHIQKIRDFHHVNFDFSTVLTWKITRNPKKFSCPECKGVRVAAIKDGYRDVRGLPMGLTTTVIRVVMHRIRCADCGAYKREALSFLPSQKCHYTKKVAEYAINLRRHMCIKAVAEHLDLHWNTVKEIEKSHLEKKYRKIDLKGVEDVGIDEVYLGKRHGYLTIVRDLSGSRVLFIGEGRDSECLAPFAAKLKRAGSLLKHVAIDMGNAYASWVKDNFPDCCIIYDHFHVIKSMNDKVNTVRRRTMRGLEMDERSILKGKRFTLLKNIENLDEDSKRDLDKIRSTYRELGEMSMMKECLRNIYSIATNTEEATTAFVYWCKLAVESGIGELKTMAKTITQRLDGIVAFFSTGLTSSSMEGFNNKIGWLQRQAYGYRDLEYLKLKIYDLPKIKTTKKL
jgi:transposase